MSLTHRFIFVIFLILISGLLILPWKQFGIDTEWLNRPYTLGLDLQGGVELDYQVDLASLQTETGASQGAYSENTIIEGLKNIIDRRVNSLGLAEPTIQTVKYGSDTHIIVQIPTKWYADLSPEEREVRRAEDIQNAKETIGRVVQLEFREEKSDLSPEDYAARRALADAVRSDMEALSFSTTATKYLLQHERIMANFGTGTLPSEARIPHAEEITEFPYLSPVTEVSLDSRYVMDAEGKPQIATSTGYAVVRLLSRVAPEEYEYEYVTVDATPSTWMPAQTEDGRVLNDRYLVSASVGFTQVGQSQVELLFNDEGRAIFAELTRRLLGKQIAIFVGGELLTAPVVQSVIPDGRAVITGQSSIQESQMLADNINTGIVPAPIYLTSERTIDAKIGESALNQIVTAGMIGLMLIVVFLALFYRVWGLLTGIALIAYSLFLILIVKYTGVVLTLASIAGIILSIGLAIDANILIFERIREALQEGHPLSKAIRIGFEHSWTAIWDSHVTSLTSAFILYIFGIAMIKGFGLMLGLGILLSLFTAMWVSRVLIQMFARWIKQPSLLIGFVPKPKKHHP